MLEVVGGAFRNVHSFASSLSSSALKFCANESVIASAVAAGSNLNLLIICDLVGRERLPPLP